MRERLSLDRNWRFALGHAADPSRDFEFVRSRDLVKAGEARGAAGVKFDDDAWRVVNVPHDWAIELPLDPTGDKELAEHGFRAIGPDHPEHSIGWYRRTFEIPAGDEGRRISVEFDGVFRDSIVWINGHRLGRHQSGYTSFSYDVTDLLNYGGTNVIAVRVDASCWEGWWYEGAGIYRHVWLTKTDPLHVARCGTFVTSEVKRTTAVVTARTTIVNESDNALTFVLQSDLSPRHGFATRANRAHGLKTRATTKPIVLASWEQREIVQTIRIARPRLWSPDQPNLYRLRSTIIRRREAVDEYDTSFGIRTLRWDAPKGFFLNGKPLKIKGTCNHQQHAGVGIALPDRLHTFRLEKLKELGSNAYRCSHYAVAPELLDECDRLGFLVMAENRLAGSSPEILSQFEGMIRRDRNHPSVILWSLANEEHTVQWSIAGERIGRTMTRLAHRLDPTRKVTTAMHDRGLDEGFANVVDVHGWNYIKVGDIEAFHARRPEQPIVGSEEGSTVCTRGVYADDAGKGYVSAYDVRTPKWGSTAESWWRFFSDRPWLAGGFVWTGFDYFGEPIPYKWPCTASHFGLMDLCGFPKDNFYYYQSWWSDDRTVLHLFPHWNWEGHEGEEIDVRCFSNCDEVELFVNGRTHGRKTVVRNSHVAWVVRYEAGAIEAIGYHGKKRVATAKRETTGPAARLVLGTDRMSISADGDDVASVTVTAVDAKGRFVPTANDLVRFNISGAGVIIGIGNGDPSSHEADKGSQRSLFNGLACAIVQSTLKAGPIRIAARAAGLKSAMLTLQARPATQRPAVP